MHSHTYPLIFRRILEDENRSLKQRLQNLVRGACEALDMEVGVLSRVHPAANRYTVLSAHDRTGSIKQGQRFALGVTYCSMTISRRNLVHICHMGESPFNRHPCYTTFRMESYIGVPLLLRGYVYGTLSFASHQRRDDTHREFEDGLVLTTRDMIEQVLSTRDILYHETVGV